jgi:hypothetical protein
MAVQTRRDQEIARRNGVRVTLKSLDAKLNALNRQNEKEEVRGFTDGGVAIDDEEAKDLAAQVAMIEQQKKEIRERELKKFVEEGGKEGVVSRGGESSKKGAGDEIFQSCSSFAETESLAAAVEKKFRALGLKCDISKSKGGVITVTVDMPDRFKGQDPLKMSEDMLIKAKEELDSAKDQPSSSPKPSSWAEYVLQQRENKAQHYGHGGGMAAG